MFGSIKQIQSIMQKGQAIVTLVLCGLFIIGSTSLSQTVKNDGTINVTGTYNKATFYNYKNGVAGTLNVYGSGRATISSLLDNNFAGSTINNSQDGILTTGNTSSFNNGVGTLSNTATTGKVVIGNTLTLGTGSFTTTSSEVEYANTSATQTIASGVASNTYGKLTISGGAGTKSLGGSIVVANQISLGAGTTLNIAGYTLTLNGSTPFTGTGTLDASIASSKVIYNYAGSQSVRTATYYDLTIQNGGTKTADGDITVNNILTNSATFDLSTYGLTTGGSATITNTGGTIQTAGSVTFGAVHTIDGIFIYQASTGTQTLGAANYANLTLSGGSGTTGQKNFPTGTVGVSGTYSVSGANRNYGSGTISYNSASAQNVLGGEAYNNLTLDQASLKTLLGSITISGALALTNGATFDATTNSTTIDYNGSGAQDITAVNYYNLTFSGAHSSTAMTLANGGTIRVANTFTNSATSVTFVNTNNTFEYNGSGMQTVTPFTYNNLTLSGGGAKTVDANQTANGNVTQQSGTALHVTNAVTNWQIDGSLSTQTGFINDGVITIGN